MELTVTSITEHDDGTADVELKMDEQTKLWLINYAFVEIIKIGLDNIKEFDGKDIKVEFID